MRPLFLLRWSVRDLRHRWVQVAAIALIIAIGTGIYAALGSTAGWRRESNDASFARLGMYDLRVRTAEGVDASRGEMLAALRRLPHPDAVTAAEERLIMPTQVDASRDGRTILVPGRVVGVDVTHGGPAINAIDVSSGRGRNLVAADDGERVAVIERNFADFHHLPIAGSVRVAGGGRLRYVGQGLAPEYFLVTTEEGGFFAEANFAVLFVPLATAQQLTGRPGRVNDLILQLRPGADAEAVAAQVRTAFAPDELGVTVMTRRDEDAYRLLYDDIEGDQRFWNVFAALILAGAAFGAFNLASRMVEAQRREIGIGMALGASPRQLALRPLLVGVEIALLGAALGVAVGLAVIAALRPVYVSVLPLPVWLTRFRPDVFARGAALGFVVPLVATAVPVWRAVRVPPIEAITTTHRALGGGLARFLRRLPRPLSTFRRMPLANVLRTPRRTLLSLLGIGAAVATLVAILGMLDSFLGTMANNERELLGQHPDRVMVALDRFVPVSGTEVAAITATRSVGRVEPVVRLGGKLSAAGTSIDVLVEAMDMRGTVWSPSLRTGNRRPGLIIAAKAATDLGVSPGDTIVLQHPRRVGAGISITQTRLVVAGIHPGPFRFNAYLDSSALAPTGFAGLANELYVLPAKGMTVGRVERDLFDLDGVASLQPVATAATVVKDSVESFTGILRIIEGFILLLLVLIAYNATSINADERAKERATLVAFGVPLRRLLGLEAAEGVMHGILGSLVGLGIGTLVVRWVTTRVFTVTAPDMGLEVLISSGTIATACGLAVVTLGAAPLLTVRRLRRMDVPGTLRITE